MQGSRKRRIVRRIALTLAAVVLLVSWYVGAWLAVSRAEHDRFIWAGTAQKVRPVFAPILHYCKTDLPGAGVLCHLWWSVNPPMLDFSQPRFSGPSVRGLYSALAPPRTTASREALKAALMHKTEPPDAKHGQRQIRLTHSVRSAAVLRSQSLFSSADS